MQSVSPLYTNGFFLLVWYNKLRIAHYTYLGVSDHTFQNYIVFFCFTCINSVDTDEMLHMLHNIRSGSSLFAKVLIQGFPEYNGLITCFVKFVLNHQKCLPVSQFLPVYPVLHVHEYPPVAGKHVPCIHWVGLQCDWLAVKKHWFGRICIYLIISFQYIGSK